MSLRPSNRDALSHALKDASARGTAVGAIDLGALNRVLEYTPEDMTVTVEAGMTLQALQEALGRRGQWLPIDPPFAERLTIRELLEGNVSGPHRFGHGTIRDHLIGLRVVLADGRIVFSGGKVVKNVAGFDLLKLFIGAHGSLGIIIEATFKLLPLPEREAIIAVRCDAMDSALTLVESLAESPLSPVVFDLHRLVGAGPTLVLGFAGAREDVAWHLEDASKLANWEPSNLGYDTEFQRASPAAVRRHSVLPSRLGELLRELGDAPFVARAGNGVVYHRGVLKPPSGELPLALFERVKTTFDPGGILPPLPL